MEATPSAAGSDVCFLELATAIRLRSGEILDEWEQLVSRTLSPAARRVCPTELRDNLAEVLSRIADALEAPGGVNAAEAHPDLLHRGLNRFRQGFLAADLLSSERCLRRAVLEQVMAALRRPPDCREIVTLLGVLDAALHQGTLAFVERQQAELAAAADAERKFLSFLSHDLGNHLTGTRLWLTALHTRLAGSLELADHARTAEQVRRTIDQTVSGMRQLLEHERLRRAAVAAPMRRVELAPLASDAAREHSAECQENGLRIAVDIPRDATAETDPELLGIILHNLVGNAVKYARRGTVRITAEHPRGGGGWLLSVADEGPGIAPDRLGQIFDTFRRGEMHGRGGVGLGLAIASQAAKLLGTELSVESEVGRGSTFRLHLPEA